MNEKVKYFKILSSGRVQVLVDGVIRSIEPQSAFWKQRFKGGLTAHLGDEDAARYQSDLRERNAPETEQAQHALPKSHSWPEGIPDANYFDIPAMERAPLCKTLPAAIVQKWRLASLAAMATRKANGQNRHK